MRKFFAWWSYRVQHIFTAEKRQENFYHKIITVNCVFWWRFWFIFLWLGFLLLCLPLPALRAPIPIARRVIVRGRTNLLKTTPKNRVVFPNHSSHLGPPLLFFAGFMPLSVINPQKYFPWQTPNKRIANDPALFLGRMSPLIWVDSDEHGLPRDAKALLAIVRRLKTNTVIVFIEGTRSYHAKEPKVKTSSGIDIGYPFLGGGALVYYSKPTAIPALIKGEDKIYPPSASLKHVVRELFLGRHSLEVIFGKPIDMSWVPRRDKKLKTQQIKEIARVISEMVVRKIAALDVTR